MSVTTSNNFDSSLRFKGWNVKLILLLKHLIIPFKKQETFHFYSWSTAPLGKNLLALVIYQQYNICAVGVEQKCVGLNIRYFGDHFCLIFFVIGYKCMYTCISLLLGEDKFTCFLLKRTNYFTPCKQESNIAILLGFLVWEVSWKFGQDDKVIPSYSC